MKNDHELEEARRQETADLATDDTKPGDDAAVDRHRFIRHAIRKADAPRPPQDFAARMERMVQDFAEDAVVEQWLVRISVAAGLATLAGFGIAAIGEITDTALARYDVPWGLLLAGLASGVVAWAIEHLGHRQH